MTGSCRMPRGRSRKCNNSQGFPQGAVVPYGDLRSERPSIGIILRALLISGLASDDGGYELATVVHGYEVRGFAGSDAAGAMGEAGHGGGI